MIFRTVSLAGQRFDLRVKGDVDEDHIDARFGGFYSEDDTPELGRVIEVSIEVKPGWELDRAVCTPFPGVDWRREGREEIFCRETECVRFDPDAGRVSVYAKPTGKNLAAVVDPTPVDTPLRLLLAYGLPRRDGVLLHASGYADRRGAVCFLAVSGGGKTTTARKLPERNVLSDDQVALRRIDGQWQAFALPFVGEWARATQRVRAPLRAVVLLQKGSVVGLERVTGVAAFAGVARSMVNFVTGDPVAARFLDHAAALVTEIPVWRWVTTKDGAVEDVLREVLERE